MKFRRRKPIPAWIIQAWKPLSASISTSITCRSKTAVSPLPVRLPVTGWRWPTTPGSSPLRKWRKTWVSRTWKSSTISPPSQWRFRCWKKSIWSSLAAPSRLKVSRSPFTAREPALAWRIWFTSTSAGLACRAKVATSTLRQTAKKRGLSSKCCVKRLATFPLSACSPVLAWWTCTGLSSSRTTGCRKTTSRKILPNARWQTPAPTAVARCRCSAWSWAASAVI